MIQDCKWQWVSNHFGPMGWFTDADKRTYEGTAEFKAGYWRALSEPEVKSMTNSIKDLAYSLA